MSGTFFFSRTHQNRIRAKTDLPHTSCCFAAGARHLAVAAAAGLRNLLDSLRHRHRCFGERPARGTTDEGNSPAIDSVGVSFHPPTSWNDSTPLQNVEAHLASRGCPTNATSPPASNRFLHSKNGCCCCCLVEEEEVRPERSYCCHRTDPRRRMGGLFRLWRTRSRRGRQIRRLERRAERRAAVPHVKGNIRCGDLALIGWGLLLW